MRNLTWLDYNSGGKEIVKEYEDCELAIIMCLLEGEYSFIKIFPVKRPLGFFVEYKIDGIEQSPIYHYN